MVGIRNSRARTLPDHPTDVTAPLGKPRPDREFSALERVEIVKDAVDFLFPRITPNEAACYLYLLRRSILANGEPYVRLSRSELTRSAVGSSHRRPRKGSTSKTIGLRTVQKALVALEKIGAIRKESEPNRQGTLYRVLVPDEIEACREAMRSQRAAEPRPVDAKAEADYYNVRENRHQIFERDGYRCRYCDKQLTRFTATLDHVTPVREGGGNGYANLVTACLDCNSTKTGRALGDFLAARGKGGSKTRPYNL